jgi:hypothetical protein
MGGELGHYHPYLHLLRMIRGKQVCIILNIFELVLSKKGPNGIDRKRPRSNLGNQEIQFGLAVTSDKKGNRCIRVREPACYHEVLIKGQSDNRLVHCPRAHGHVSAQSLLLRLQRVHPLYPFAASESSMCATELKILLPS